MSPSSDNHEPEEEQLAEGTLMSHLLELRSRLMKAVFAVVIVLIGLTPFSQRVFEYRLRAAAQRRAAAAS